MIPGVTSYRMVPLLWLMLHICYIFVGQTRAEVPHRRHTGQSRSGRVKICDNKFSAISNHHTACIQSPRRRTEGMSQSTKSVVLGLHNYYRSKVGKADGQPSASDMQIMNWDHELADLAQRWASNCLYAHDNKEDRVIPGRFYVGQNIAWTSLYDWKFTLEAWHDEYKYFRYGSGATQSGKLIGHYTQMVWAESTKLGCGYAFCNRTKHFYVCNYGLIGNVEQPHDRNAKFRPYRIGHSLSACPYNRRKGLCDCQGKVCLNGGTLDVSTCTCRCINRPWIEQNNICALKCEVARDGMMCSRKMWGPEYCLKFINVPYQYCPVMCNWCPAHTSNRHAPANSVSQQLQIQHQSNNHRQSNHRAIPKASTHRKTISKSKPFGENELPLGDQPLVADNSTTTSTTTATTTVLETTTSPYIASTTTLHTTNNPVTVTETLQPPCLQAEQPICGQPNLKGFYPPKYCSHPTVRLTCPAMCGTCSSNECIDYDGHRFQPGSNWLTGYGRVNCTKKGATFTTGCVKDATSPDGIFVDIGGSTVYRKAQYQYTCSCSRVGRKKKLSCIRKWIDSER